MMIRILLADLSFFLGNKLVILSAWLMGYNDTVQQLRMHQAQWLQTDAFKIKPQVTFTQWYKETQGCEWHRDFAHLYSHSYEMAEAYRQWCEDNKQEPVWNG